jgi:hypothetical protein
MGEYEPDDSRNVTLKQKRAPGEPPRTGPREAETRQQQGQQQAGETELEQDERGEEAEQTPDPQAEQAMREGNAEERDEEPGRLDRND